jgi:hypothetical protein
VADIKESGSPQKKSLFEKNPNENKFTFKESSQKPEGRKTIENFTNFNFEILDPNFEKERKKIEEKKSGKLTNGLSVFFLKKNLIKKLNQLFKI